MPLTLEQLETLSRLVKTRRPPWEVNMFLMKDCGLKFREASDERYRAMKIYNQVPNEKIEEPIPVPPPNNPSQPSTAKKEIHSQDEIGSLFDTEEANRSYGDSEPGYNQEDDTCVTCHKLLSENCACEIRLVSDIPF